jgi:tetratricopeptide (TPR) repeat protein
VTTSGQTPETRAPPARVFVGRQRELAELEAHLEAASAGHGGLVLLGGEPGVGKTRLLGELATRSQPRGVTALWGRCWEEGGAPPYWPWAQVLRAELRRETPERLLAEIGAQSALLSVMLPELAARTGPRPAEVMAGLESVDERFALFDAVATCFRAMARRGPVLLLLDDVHAADRPSLRLLAFLAHELRGTSVLVVCAHRQAEVRATPAVAEALAEAARDGAALALGGLSERDVARFLEVRAGVRASSKVVTALHRRTGGNPFFLDEVVRLLVAEGRLDERGLIETGRLAVPLRIHDAIDRRLGPLSPACRGLLELVSVIGLECRLGHLGVLADATPAVLRSLLEEARVAGIVTLGAPPDGRVRFVHALFREALYGALADQRRVALHGVIGRLLEERPDARPAELAHHFLEAAAEGRHVERAIAHARRAAVDATDRLAYEDAAGLYERALQALDLTPAPDPVLRGELLADLGDAERRVGDVEAARRTFEQAMALARRLEPARGGPLLARAVLGIAGSGAEVGRADPALVQLLDDALAAIAPADGPLRARLLARLAAELAYVPDDARHGRLSEEAVAMAERLGDPETLGYALAKRNVVLMEPSNAVERRELASSIIELARRTGDRELAAEGRGWRLFTHLELGDLAGVERDLDGLCRLAEETRHPHYLWLATMFRAMRALLAARFDEAEQLAGEALALGQRHADPNALVAYGAQLYVLRWGQGRLDEIEPLLRDFAAQHRSQPVWESARAHHLAMTGRLDEARMRFVPACDSFLGLSRDVTWLPNAGLLGETCAVLADRARAPILHGLLRPFASQQLVAGPGAASFGAAGRVVGLLAAAMEQWDEALDQLDRAEALNERMGALAWVAQTAIDRAAVLVARDGPRDREAARASLARARALATRLDLRRVLTCVETIATRLGDEEAEIPPVERQLLRHEGDHWTVEFAGRALRVRDAKGIRLLAQLLRRPGEEVHVVTLVAAADGDPPRDLSRVALDESERHRVSVTRAIHGLLDRIATSHPALAEHLARTVRTGTVCSYTPDARMPTTWGP